ncbi:hypothetical protein [Fodinicola feengrottensis]|uniref:hypothetical protein n=1 Tax=Fodinicola feengrottensis TaxID=435914 RepID=UPI0036F3FFC7
MHRCAGAPLARLEGDIALRTLLRRLPEVALGCQVEEVRWRADFVIHGVTALPVTFTRA